MTYLHDMQGIIKQWLIDTYDPHLYFVSDSAKFYWVFYIGEIEIDCTWGHSMQLRFVIRTDEQYMITRQHLIVTLLETDMFDKLETYLDEICATQGLVKNVRQ